MATFRSGPVSLTSRQEEVLRLIAKGFTNGEIAEKLGISIAGAKWHVSELLMKFDVENREELVERWRAEAGLKSRMASLGWGIVGAFSPKVIGLAAMAVVVAGGGGVVALALSNAGGDGSVEAASETATVAFTPSPVATTATILGTPAVSPGRLLPLPEEIREQAFLQAIAGLAKVDEFSFVSPLDATQLTVTEARFHPGATLINMVDPDLYWQHDEPVDAWYAHLEGKVLTRGALNFDDNVSEFLGDLRVDVVIRDGTLELLGVRSGLWVNGVLKDGGGGIAIRSRAFEEDQRLHTTQVGESYIVAHLDAEAGDDRLEVYNNLSGTYCIEVYQAQPDHPGGAAVMRGCGIMGEIVARFLQAAGGPMGVPFFSPSGLDEGIAMLIFPTRITRFDLVGTDGTVRSFDLTPAAPELGIDASFAMVGVDLANGAPTVIAYAGDTEAGRWPVQIP